MKGNIKKSFNKYEGEPPWLTETREEFYNRYINTGWPSARAEEWRRTPPERLEAEKFLNAGKKIVLFPRKVKIPDVDTTLFSGIIKFSGDRYAFVPPAGDLLFKGVVFLPIEEAMKNSTFAGHIKMHIGAPDTEVQNKYDLMRLGSSNRGYFLYIPPGIVVEKPFYIEFEENGRSGDSYFHGLVTVERGAGAVIIQNIKEKGKHPVFLNSGVNMKLKDRGKLDFISIQSLMKKSKFYGYDKAVIGAQSEFHYFSAHLGGEVSRTKLETYLEGKKGSAIIKGVYFGDPGQHFDMLTTNHHIAANTKSHTLYKGCLKEGARSVYQGKIEVEKGASGTDAYLSNKNLILGKGARADSIPKLVIRNNDVKCSHGSATGKLDQAEIFYLMSRGFSEKEARALLINGYFQKVSASLPMFAGNVLSGLIDKKIGG